MIFKIPFLRFLPYLIVVLVSDVVVSVVVVSVLVFSVLALTGEPLDKSVAEVEEVEEGA